MSRTLLYNLTNQKRCLYLILGLFFFFIQKTGATTFYINDGDTKGDIYTTAAGNDDNDGTAAASPKSSIWNTYQKAQDGDTIIIDTGSYADLSVKGEILFTVAKKITFVIAGVSDAVFSKTPLPANIKVNPTEIYIDKDKPIDREAYLQGLRNRKTKKPQ